MPHQPGPERGDDRRVIAGIVHVVHALTSGCRWCDGPATTVDDRFDRQSRRGLGRAMLAALARAGWSGEASARAAVVAFRC